jgi:hypothetical protein
MNRLDSGIMPGQNPTVKGSTAGRSRDTIAGSIFYSPAKIIDLEGAGEIHH